LLRLPAVSLSKPSLPNGPALSLQNGRGHERRTTHRHPFLRRSRQKCPDQRKVRPVQTYYPMAQTVLGAALVSFASLLPWRLGILCAFAWRLGILCAFAPLRQKSHAEIRYDER
jgi:hypothetical protein